MWQSLFLLSMVITMGHAAYLDDTYFAMMPKILRPSQPFDVSLTYTYYGQTGQARVTLELVGRDSPTPIKTQSYTMPPANCGTGFTGACPVTEVLSMQMPDGSTLSMSQYNITIRGELDGVTFSNSTSVRVKRKVTSIFIQTDRAMYKPSQTVKFRVLSVDANLRPVQSTLNISIHDTSDNRLKQWLNVNMPSDGVISKELALSDQPPLGPWRIQVEGQDTGEVKIFEVAEYVLPKYEVTVDAPSFWLTSSDKISASVGAKYTYGQPVKGYCVIAVQVKPYYYDSSTYTNITINKTLVDGKADFEIPKIQLLRIVPTNRWTRWSEEWATQQLSYRELLIAAKCTETLTSKTFAKNGTVPVKSQKFNLQFMELTPDNYKPGLDYPIYLQVTLPDGMPPQPSDLVFPNGTAMKIEVRDRTRYYYYRPGPGSSQPEQPPANWTLDIDSTGMAHTSFRVPADKTSLDLTATLNDGMYTATAFRYVEPFKSRDNQSISVTIVDSTGELKAGEDVKFLIKTSEPSTQAYLQLMSKSRLAYVAVIRYSSATETIHTIRLDDSLAQKLAPKGRAIVYYSTSKDEIISDSVDFSVEGAFANDVSLQFNVSEAKPADKVKLTINAYPQSYVGVLALDQSALLLASGNDLNRDYVLDEIESYDSTNSYDDYYPGRPGIGFGGGFGQGERGRKKRSSIWCPWCYGSTGGKDTKEVFENSGVLVLTDRYIYVEPPPQYYYRGDRGERGPVMGIPGPGGPAMPVAAPAPVPAPPPAGERGRAGPGESAQSGMGGGGGGGLQEPTRVRSNFPETWLWTEDHTGADGKVDIVSQVPDTITSWVTSAFAMHPIKGLGISEDTADVTVFKPFFVDINMPYNLIRKEEAELKINVFNYLATEQQVLVTVEKSDHFGVKKANDIEYMHAKATVTLTVPSGDAATFTIWMQPLALGSIPIEIKAQSNQAADAIRKTILVEPEGAPQEYNANFLINLSDQNEFMDEVNLDLPSDGLVPGSVRVMASLVGDIMGPAMSNLDHLVKMPSGCGEQNMLNFVPNIVVMQYMEAAGKSDPDLENKAQGYMEKGYQRELTYQHYDGSFSAFGNSDPSGSTWLTAFVLKSFCQARTFIDVDPNKILMGYRWIMAQQESDGKFGEPGRVIHTDMQGGAASGIALTGYVTVALVEACYLDTQEGLQAEVDSSVAQAISYLLNKYDEGAYSTDPYTLSIVAYALAKTGHSRADELMNVLVNLAEVENGMMHWKKQEPDTSIKEYVYEDRVVFVPPRRQATASEIETTSYGLLTMVISGKFTEGIPVMKWLVSQRNSLGGYSSTQDTVMALQSLAMYAGAAAADGQQDIEVTMEANGVQYTFPNRVTPTNAMVLQMTDITEAQGERLVIIGRGTGIALVQVSVEYNIDNVFDEPGMNMEVTSQRISDGLVHVEVCAWYTGDLPSGMVGMEVNPLSGYVATNLEDLRKEVRELSRVEMVGKKYMFYFNQLNGVPTCVTVHMERVNMVANVQKARVATYLYYEPVVKRTGFYLPQELLNQDACHTCPSCCVPGGIDANVVFTDISYCKDFNDNCAFWASAGECDINPKYMLQKCRVSCNKCGTLVQSCEDTNDYCPFWAAIDQCNLNPGYMLKGCKKSCKQCGSGQTPPCVDQNDNCQYWAENDECNINPNYMLVMCPRSCKQC